MAGGYVFGFGYSVVDDADASDDFAKRLYFVKFVHVGGFGYQDFSVGDLMIIRVSF